MRVLVLWLSRHPLLPVQEEKIREYLGNPLIKRLPIHVDTAENLYEMLKAVARKYDKVVVIPILPLGVIMRLLQLVKGDDKIEVWWAEMREVARTRSLEEAQRLVGEKPGRRTIQSYGSVHKVFEFIDFYVLEDIVLVKREVKANLNENVSLKPRLKLA